MKEKASSRLVITHPRYYALKYCLKAFEDVRGRVLDVGCGAGVMTKEIKRLRPDLKVYGIDNNPQAIKLAKKNTRGVKFSLDDAYHLPFKDNYFEATFNHHVLEHLKSPSRALGEIFRVTKKGGKIYAAVPLEGNWSSIHALFYKLPAYKAMRIKYTGHVQQYSFGEIKELFRAAGFQIVDYYWSGFLLAQLVNFLYYPFINFFHLRKSFLTENDLLLKENNFYARAGIFIKDIICFLMTLESLPLARVPQEIIHLSGKKL